MYVLILTILAPIYFEITFFELSLDVETTAGFSAFFCLVILSILHQNVCYTSSMHVSLQSVID